MYNCTYSDMKGGVPMNNRSSKIAVFTAAIALCLSVVSLCLVLDSKKADIPEPSLSIQADGDIAADEVQYVVYLGTNDKDTNEPVFPPEEARGILEDILLERMGGYTIQEARGGWIGDDGMKYQEYTLVIILSDTDEAAVHALCDELIERFDQNSVMIQTNETTTEFYSRSEG